MNRDVLDYLKGKEVGVLAVKMPDGSPHGATLHFALVDEPLMFIFSTSPTYRKAEALTGDAPTPATLVIGADESAVKTLQLDGSAVLADTPMLRAAYFARFPDKDGKYPDNILFTFTPAWWRFTDWTKPEGETIQTSDGKVA